MRNPFRFGGRWSWCQVRVTDTPIYDNAGQAAMQVEATTRRWHPLFWLFVAVYALKHVRIRIERAR